MAITSDNFTPRPGFVNKQGCLPDPIELVCVEVPKVFDQCLIKRCLKFKKGPDTFTTDEELRSTPLTEPKMFLGCRDFNIKLLSAEKVPIPGECDFSKLFIDFMISFNADYLDCSGNHCSEFFEVNRSEIISKFYCPDPIAKTSSSAIDPDNNYCDDEIIKLELVADCLDGQFNKDCNCCDVLDITLGFHLIVKCELIVQLLIPAYGYCPVPKPCKKESLKDPCEIFNKHPVPKFYPDQKLKPLFECDCD
ncbi:hypothetical protein AAGC94_22150 [Clostridium sporogenes]|uniref:Uncharacterized protein n=1 Tax=Clostridium cochlearium TaxID=1494 RepID=A0A2X2W488_CLOCO|nr:hypothetical protein [Clostridium cochlearium]MBE6065720.1 hypothetical protein [Clostridium cochlearium]MBU5270548.1 hypothetical protein [Clostridium cochlearium]MDU1442533.1 hypothetical protein [Clostridium cochlearium]SQB34207.1 Uncharacterised protein [Clostridium cochlearium]